MMSRTRLVMLAGAACAVALANPAVARPQASTHYVLPSQDLGVALRQVGQIAGVDVMFAPEAVAGITAPPIDGTLTLSEVLDRLLAGTGLTASYANGAVIIRGRSAPAELAAGEIASADIIVTGTHIRHSQPTSPVITATREEIERTGRASLGEYIRDLPQNFGGGQNPGIAGGGAQGGNENVGSTSALNLRGLGPDATLS